jgi:transposase
MKSVTGNLVEVSTAVRFEIFNGVKFYDDFIKDKYKNHLIIMDNAVIHKSRLIREKIETNNNTLLHSVPYHPETNAIEEFFSQLKNYIKKESPNTYGDIYRVISTILEKKITKEHLTLSRPS